MAARRVGLRAHASGLPSASWPSGSRLPLFGTHRFGVALGGLAFGLTASAFRHAPHRRLPSAGCFFRLPFRSCRSAGWPSGSLLPLFGMRRFGVATGRVRSSAFRFGDYRWAGWPSGSPLPLFGLRRFGVAAGRVRSSAFRFGDSPRRVGLRTHGFRFSARTASEWPLGGLAFGLPLRSGLGGLVLPLGGLVFGLTASAFRPAPLRSGRWASSFFRLPFRSCRSSGWPSGSPLPLFGMRRSAPPHRRSEGRRSTPTRHLFHFKTLIPTC